MNLFKRIFQHNWIAILYFNFKMLPIKQAIKLPFDFYHKVRFVDLSGKIILNCNKIKRGTFNWGLTEYEIFPNVESVISIKGTLIINDIVIAFGSGTTLEIDENAVLELNGDITIAPGTKIILQERVQIGKHARIGWESQILDSNFHYIRNIATNEIPRRTKPIFIGNNCWIGNRVTINKGTILPNHSIVASNSLCNKDYTINTTKYPTLAGCPAMQIAQNYEMVLETTEEELIKQLLKRDKNNLLED